MSAESDALWLEAEAEWFAAVDRKAEELEGRAQKLAFVNLFAGFMNEKGRECRRREDLLAVALRGAVRARDELTDATNMAERMFRMLGAE